MAFWSHRDGVRVRSCFLRRAEGGAVSLSPAASLGLETDDWRWRVAEINGCSYSLSAHQVLAQRLGLSEEEIRLTRKATALDPQTRAMLRFIQAVVLQRGEISRDELQALRTAGFIDAQIVEIIAGIGLNIFTNYFNLLAKTQVDFPRPKPGMQTPGTANHSAANRTENDSGSYGIND